MTPTPIAVTPSPRPTVVVTPSPTSTPVASATPTVALSALREFQNGRWLEQEDPKLASSIKELGWVKDGIEGIEYEAVENLLYIAVLSRTVASSIVSLSWVQDGVDGVEPETIGWLNNIGSAEVASAVVSLGWVADGIDETEVKAIQEISYIDYRDTEVAFSVVSMDWVRDGIDGIEAEALDWINNMKSAEVASAVVSLGWVADGIEEIEVKAIEEISYIDYRDSEVASSVVSLGWVQDGIEAMEVDAIEELSYLANRDAEAAMRVVAMPFVETIEPPDVSAITSLRLLAAYRPETFVGVMSHTALSDGITDDLAPIVATLNGVAENNPRLVDVLLDRSKVSLEQRNITLPLTGDVVLFIIRTGPGAATSMDLLEHSVRGVEKFMGLPLPTNYVGLLYEDAVSGNAAGTNFGTHIAILPKYDIDDGSREAEFASSNNAHEVAHYYWSGNGDWVDEGAAEFLASVIDGARTGRPIAVSNPPCGHAGSLAELESLGISKGDLEFRCNYSLGERLFVDLYRTLGHERFRQGFRALYLTSEIEDEDEDVRGTSVGIEHIREAFRSDGGPERVVISRWYDGAEPYDLSRLDTGPVDPILPSINGRIEKAYVITSLDGPAVTTFSAQDVSDWVYLTLEYLYDVSSGPREVPLEIVEFYEDGFEFSRRSGELTAEARYIGGTAWFSVGQSPSRQWAPGRYWVYVYAGERKGRRGAVRGYSLEFGRKADGLREKGRPIRAALPFVLLWGTLD